MVQSLNNRGTLSYGMTDLHQFRRSVSRGNTPNVTTVHCESGQWQAEGGQKGVVCFFNADKC